MSKDNFNNYANSLGADRATKPVQALALTPNLGSLNDPESDGSITERFINVVSQFSNRVAIQTKNNALTYAELDRRANQFAAALIGKTSGEPTPMGILLPMGIEQIAAMLGVLKAGKFFILLDVESPPSRIAAILAESDTQTLVTDGRWAETIRPQISRAIRIVSSESINTSSTVYNASPRIAPDDIAFISFTSGSTGQPKGVIQTHRIFLHQFKLRARSGGINDQDRLALLSSAASNTVSNSLQALLCGATLFPFDVKKEGARGLASWLIQERISVCPMSSSLFRALCQTLRGQDNFPDLRYLRLRSESAYKSDVEEYKKYFSRHCSLVHGLSSSETWTLCEYIISHDSEIPGAELPVGYPVQDKEILLLDDEGQVLGPNQVGEIVVRSRYLSPGYWKRPDLTESKFKSDPQDPETRIYHTGDLGMMLPNGCLIHKGRKDFRVKIRGYGVDLAEVEKALRGHPSIRQAVVADIQTGSGASHLAAYVTMAYQNKLNVSELRQFLSTKLADYMIPSIFTVLEDMPLTASGKIDRAHLPMPRLLRPELTQAFAAPRNATEEKLARIWKDVLGVDRVGIFDNFFDLGGHSLLAVKLLCEVEKNFGKNIPVSTLLKSPSVAQFVDSLAKCVTAKSSPLVAIHPDGAKPPFFCVHGADGYGRLAEYLGVDQPFYGLAQHLEDAPVSHFSIESIAAYYLEAVRSVQAIGPYFLGGHSIGGLIAFEMAQQLQAFGQEVRLLILLDSGAPRKAEKLAGDGAHHESAKKHRTIKHAMQSLRSKLQALPQHGREILRYQGKTLRCEYYHRLGKSLPGPLKMFYIDEVVYRTIYPKAHRNYQPQPYSGRVVYLKSDDTRERVAGWERLMGRGLEVRRVPGNHLSMLSEPNLRCLAETLTNCLAEAQPNSQSRATKPGLDTAPVAQVR